MENLGVVYELDSNNCSKNYTDKKGRQLKERIKEHKNDGKKSQKGKKRTGFHNIYNPLAIQQRVLM